MRLTLASVGADPEIFCLDADGHPFSAEGLFGGSKHEPKPMEGYPEGYFIQEDNVAAEYNIPPCFDAQSFEHAIFKGLSYITKVAKKNKLTLSYESALNFSVEQLSTEHAQLLGCEPDFNVWTKEKNPRPKAPFRLRTAAGHIHVGLAHPTDEQRFAVVKLFEVFLTVPSVLATKPNARRSLYGQSGSYRPKKYGVECRTLDNFWLKSKPQTQHIFQEVLNMINTFNREGEFLMEEIEDNADRIRNCINMHNKDEAMKLMDLFGAMAFPE